MRWLVVLLVALGGLTSACDSSDEPEAPQPNRYRDESLWLCWPGMSDDQCYAHDLTATEILPDNTTRIVEHEPASEPGYDCFYVYPTVDISFTPGNHEDLSDIDPMLDPLLSQAAMFTSLCRVFAPLYRQGTIGIYGSEDPDTYLEYAYSDVEEAFRYYLDTEAQDRSFVIMGHSQGTHMTRRLLQRLIEPDPVLRARLIAALLIGGDVSVPDGDVVGGSFHELPLCTASSGDSGCVVAYRSYAADRPPNPGAQISGFEHADQPGFDAGCNNPAELATGAARFHGTYFPTEVRGDIPTPGHTYPVEIDTPFVLYRDLFAGECLKDSDGVSYLSISVDPDANDQRENPVPFEAAMFNPSSFGHQYTRF